MWVWSPGCGGVRVRGSLQSQEEAILGNSTPTGADTTGGQAVVTGEGVTRPHTHTHTHTRPLPAVFWGLEVHKEVATSRARGS